METMKKPITVLLASLTLLLAACGSEPEAGTPLGLAQQVATKAFKTLEPTALAWGSLMPADYEPSYQPFPWEVEDSEARMQQILQETPLVEALDGQEVKVSGYVVPLSGDEEAISEFLLVPFLGACVHVPPAARQPDRLRQADLPAAPRRFVRRRLSCRHARGAGPRQRVRRGGLRNDGRAAHPLRRGGVRGHRREPGGH